MVVGGFKTWECSVDLLNVLHERKVQADQVLEVKILGSVLCQGAEALNSFHSLDAEQLFLHAICSNS